MERWRHLGIGAVFFASVLTACAGGGAYGGAGTTSTSTGPAAGGTTVAAADSDLGTILVDGDGFTLYLFEQDTGTTSTCTDDCAATWPPLLADGDATAGDGATGALGTITRDDGTTQVTYDGHPLYRYAGDAAAGETNGQGLGEQWFAVTPEGTAAAVMSSDDGYSRGGYG